MPFCEILEPGEVGAGRRALWSPRLPTHGAAARVALALHTGGCRPWTLSTPLLFGLLSSTPTLPQSLTKLELLPQGPSGSAAAKRGAASPSS